MASVFTRIIAGELPGHIPYTDDQCIVLLSINPIAPGHCLVIPRKEVDHWSDLDGATALHLMEVAHRLAGVLRGTFPCERVGIMIAGFEVPHCHVHVIPTRSMRDMDFANAAKTVDHSQLADYAQRIRAALS